MEKFIERHGKPLEIIDSHHLKRYCVGKHRNMLKQVTRYVILSEKITLDERQYTLEWKRGFNLWLCILRNFHSAN